MSQPYSKKIAGYAVCCISALAVVTVSQMSQADAASMTFSVTGTNSASKNALASSVVFDDLLNPGKLTVTLTNMKMFQSLLMFLHQSFGTMLDLP